MCMYVCPCVCVHVCTVCMCVPICMCVSVLMCMYVCLYIHVHVHMCTMCTCAHMHVCLCALCMCVVYIYVCDHVHMCAHMCMCAVCPCVYMCSVPCVDSPRMETGAARDLPLCQPWCHGNCGLTGAGLLPASLLQSGSLPQPRGLAATPRELPRPSPGPLLATPFLTQ